MEKKITYAIVATNKATRIRKVFAGGMTKERAKKRLAVEKADPNVRKYFRYLKVAKEAYKPRMEGSLGKTINNHP